MASRTVYQGGASAEVLCGACGIGSTSGSWRRGWPVLPQGHVNLCNRCGQKWQKAGRPNSLAELRQAEERKARGGGGAGSGGGGVKRLEGAPPGAPSATPAKRPRQLPPLAPPLPPPPRQRRISDEDDAEEEEEWEWENDEEARPASSAGAPVLPSRSRPYAGAAGAQPQPTALRAVPQQAGGSSGPFVSYCIQKLASGRANHAAFWLQDEHGESLLAVVGTDARLSGHFTYSTTPAFMELRLAPALRCTNRGEVQAWLAGFGLTQQVSETGVRLPELSAEERKRLLNPDQRVWARPTTALTGRWRGVREESGRLTDGRHFKRFFMIPADGSSDQEKLVVTGVDSHRQDRRYKYYAEESMGGFAFENGREVVEWITFVLGRPADDPVEPEQTRVAQPMREEEAVGSLMARLRGAAQQDRQAAPPAGVPAVAGGRARAEGKAAKEAAGGGGPAGSPYSAALGGKVRPVPSYQLLRRGALGEGQGGEGGDPPYPPARSSGNVQMEAAAAAAGLPRLGLRCSACGLTDDHSTEECHSCLVSPPALIHTSCAHRTHSLLLLPIPANPLFAAATASSGGGASGSGSPLQLLTQEQLRAALHSEASSLEPAAGTKPFSADVQEAFAPYPHLLSFVTALPSEHTRDVFCRWADKLSSHISDTPPPLPTCADDTPVGGWTFVPTKEALGILQELAGIQVNLSLLEGTGISRAVAQLRTHSSRDIAVAAEGLVRRWRSCAVAALEQAVHGLEQRA